MVVVGTPCIDNHERAEHVIVGTSRHFPTKIVTSKLLGSPIVVGVSSELNKDLPLTFWFVSLCFIYFYHDSYCEVYMINVI